MEIVKPLFSGSNKTLASLMSDEDCKRGIIKNAAQEMLNSKEVFVKYPNEQLIAIAMSAIKTKDTQTGEEKGFASDEEAYYVGNMFCKHIKTKDILLRVTDYCRDDEEFFSAGRSHLELGEKCLISLSLFEEAIKRRNTPPSFLKYIGVREFTKEGFQEIAEHFSLWTGMFQKYIQRVSRKYKKDSERKYLINPAGA